VGMLAVQVHLEKILIKIQQTSKHLIWIRLNISGTLLINTMLSNKQQNKIINLQGGYLVRTIFLVYIFSKDDIFSMNIL
jgi:hypothetical protein